MYKIQESRVWLILTGSEHKPHAASVRKPRISRDEPHVWDEFMQLAGLLRRFIEAGTKPGDLILDPFAGCATSLVAAEELDRQWIGIDVSPVAVRLVKERMQDELGLFGLDIIEQSDVPRRKGKRSKNIRELLYGKQAGNGNLCRVHFELRNMTVGRVAEIFFSTWSGGRIQHRSQ